jgi:hypothetical protein
MHGEWKCFDEVNKQEDKPVHNISRNEMDSALLKHVPHQATIELAII